MEQGPEKRPRPGGRRLTAAGAALCLACAVALTGGGVRTAQTAAPARLDLPRQEAVQTMAAGVGDQVIPVGKAVGIKLFSDGVLVVGLSAVETQAGSRSPGRDCGLKEGDVITHINGDEVDTIEAVPALVEEQRDSPLTIQAVRGERQLQLTAAAVENRQGDYQLGVWLRDSMAGIGTVTFYDPASGVFGALGHGINDVDTAMLMPMETGSIMPASVTQVKKGTGGDPGELHGQFDLTRELGTLYANTGLGVFGRLDPEAEGLGGQAVPVAGRDQVHEGPATILSNIRGDQVEEFDIQIIKVAPQGDGTRSLTIQVTDPELLEATGGIFQGMSGSPILQDGRLAGAVTHVLVNDPTQGYGVLAETMLRQARGGYAAD